MKISEDISAVILSSGFSSRMKIPKAFLLFDSNKTFIEKIMETYLQSGISKINIVVNSGIIKTIERILSKYLYDHRIQLVLNPFAERGRFNSLKLGLNNATSSFAFLQNIDNPFTSIALLKEMVTQANHADYVVPNFQDQNGHPILISRKIVDHLQSLVGDDHILKNELNLFLKAKCSWPDERILLNINTQEEYQKYFWHAKYLSNTN